MEGSGVDSPGCIVHVCVWRLLCIYRRVVEGSGVDSPGCIVHVCVWRLLWIAAM